ncbi:unnamed protein product [Amaranthus hypochondriacus]
MASSTTRFTNFPCASVVLLIIIITLSNSSLRAAGNAFEFCDQHGGSGMNAAVNSYYNGHRKRPCPPSLPRYSRPWRYNNDRT